MRPISFGEFFSACRNRLTDGQLRMLDPDSDYYQLDECYFGWRLGQSPDGPAIWLSIVVGDVHGLQRLKHLLLDTGALVVGWDCRKGSPAYAWARYWKASIEDIGAKYPDGETIYRVLVDRRQRRQVKKEMEVSGDKA